MFAPIKVANKGKLQDVNVAVRISHPSVSQLSLYLFKGEKYVRLATGVGGAGNNFGVRVRGLQRHVHDLRRRGADVHPDGSGPVQRPVQALRVADRVQRRQPKATWRLLAIDSTGGTSGLVNCWVLGLKYEKKRS